MESSQTGNSIEKNILKKIVAPEVVELFSLWSETVFMPYKQYFLNNSLHG